MARIATVFGATGKQGEASQISARTTHLSAMHAGSSVVRALLADGAFKPRAVTRDVNSPAARKLAEQGCEVVQADMGDVEAVERAVAGTETVFCVKLDLLLETKATEC